MVFAPLGSGRLPQSLPMELSCMKLVPCPADFPGTYGDHRKDRETTLALSYKCTWNPSACTPSCARGTRVLVRYLVPFIPCSTRWETLGCIEMWCPITNFVNAPKRLSPQRRPVPYKKPPNRTGTIRGGGAVYKNWLKSVSALHLLTFVSLTSHPHFLYRDSSQSL